METKFVYLIYSEQEKIFKAIHEVIAASIPRVGEWVVVPTPGEHTIAGKVIEVVHHVSETDDDMCYSVKADVFLSSLTPVSALLGHLHAQAAK